MRILLIYRVIASKEMILGGGASRTFLVMPRKRGKEQLRLSGSHANRAVSADGVDDERRGAFDCITTNRVVDGRFVGNDGATATAVSRTLNFEYMSAVGVNIAGAGLQSKVVHLLRFLPD